jgi:hypothetical protein
MFLLLLVSGATAQVAQKPRDVIVALPSVEPIVLKAKISLAFDYTGGQIRDAIKRGDKNVTVDVNKIPRNPTPYLIASSLDRQSPSGIYRGKGQADKIGEIVGFPTKDEQLFAICKFNSPIAFPYELSTPQRIERFRRFKAFKDEVDKANAPDGQLTLRAYNLVRKDHSTWELAAGSVVVFLLTVDLRAADLLMDPEELDRIMTEPAPIPPGQTSGEKAP